MANVDLPPEISQDRLTSEVLDAAMRVHEALGDFYAAKVYRSALAVELRRRRIFCQIEASLTVNYRGEVVGEFVADLVVEDQLVLVVSAVGDLDSRSKDQVVRGLGASGLRLGLLLDFGGPELRFSRIL